MPTTDNVTLVSQQRPAGSHGGKQDIRARVTDLIKTNFASSLGQAPDIVNIFMALIQRESAFNVKNARGPNYGWSHLSRISKYSAVSKAYDSGTAVQRSNIINSAAAYGLCQVTGYYCLKGCGPSGKSELERLRPDLAGPLTVSPGEDISSKLLGEDNSDNQLLAGLIVLEGKYLEMAPKLVSQGKYSNRLTAAISAYLGLGKSDSLGTTPEAYANSIIRGSAYQIANNGIGPNGQPLMASAGGVSSKRKIGSNPDKTAASGNNLSMAGC
jgi:hypothetical protein